LPLPALAAPVQLRNAATAIAAMRALRMPPPESAIAQGIAQARIPGRLQRFEREGVAVLVDVGHNPQAARELARWLRGDATPGRTLAVFAALGDKDAAGVASALDGLVDAWHLAGLEEAGPRGLGVEAFAARLAGSPAADGTRHRTVRAALAAALREAAPDDRVLVFGSFHTAAAAIQGLAV
jgi:dihydrofolate synthase/folylpolyglutamate synthase